MLSIAWRKEANLLKVGLKSIMGAKRDANQGRSLHRLNCHVTYGGDLYGMGHFPRMGRSFAFGDGLKTFTCRDLSLRFMHSRVRDCGVGIDGLVWREFFFSKVICKMNQDCRSVLIWKGELILAPRKYTVGAKSHSVLAFNGTSVLTNVRMLWKFVSYRVALFALNKLNVCQQIVTPGGNKFHFFLPFIFLALSTRRSLVSLCHMWKFFIFTCAAGQ